MKDVKVLVAATEVTLDADRRGSATPSVVVTGDGRQRVVLTAVSPSEGSPPVESWTTIERPLREIAAGVVEQYLVTFDGTALAAGRYPVKLIAYPSEEAPEEYADGGQTVSVVVPEKVVPPPPPRKIPWLLIGIAAAVVILIVGGIVLFRPTNVEVPNLATLTEAAAKRKLTSLGFTPSVREADAGSALDVVSKQDPPAGDLQPKGSTVKIFVNHSVVVPSVIGLTQAAAQAKLRATGLTMTVASEPGPPPFGTVTAQEVAGGRRVARGTAVSVKVRVGVSVPPLVGMPLGQALGLLSSLGLQGQVTQGFNFQWPPGVVFDQNPNRGAVVPPGTVIVLVVSNGWIN